MSQRRHEASALVRGSNLNLVGGIVQVVAGFGAVFLLTRIFDDTAALGAFLTAVAAIRLAGNLGQLGIATGNVRFLAQALADGRTGAVRPLIAVGTVPALVLSIATAALTARFAEPLAALVSEPGATGVVAEYLRMFAMVLPWLVLLCGAASSSRGFGTMRPNLLWNNILRPGSQLAGLLLLLVFGVTSRAWISMAYWVPTAVAALALSFVVWRMVTALGSAQAPRWRSLARDYWRYTAPRAIATVFSTIVEWSDTLFIAGLAGVAQAGIYTASTRFLSPGRTIQQAATQALQPQISSLLAQGRREDAEVTYRVAVAWSISLTWPWFLMVLTFAPTLLGVFGEEFVTGATAVRILAAGWLLGTALGPVSAVLEMAGRSTLSMADRGLSMVANIALNLILIPRYGLTGAAIAWSTSITIDNVLPLLQVQRSIGLSPFGSMTWRVASLSGVIFGGAGVAALLFAPQNLLTAAVTTLIAGMAYLWGLWRYAPEMQLARLAGALLRRSRTSRDVG